MSNDLKLETFCNPEIFLSGHIKEKLQSKFQQKSAFLH
jgi:hypothetical protein